MPAHVTRIGGFRRWLQRAAADRTIELRGGTAIITDSAPDVYDANYLSVESPAFGAGDLVADAEAALETSHHCRVIVEDGAPGLADDFAQLGFDRVTHLVLAHTAEPDRRVDASAIHDVELDRLMALRTEATLREPWGDAEIAAQLNDAKRLVAAAVPTRFFAAVVDGDDRRLVRAQAPRRRRPDRGRRGDARSSAGAGSGARSSSTRSTRGCGPATSSTSRRSPTTGRGSCTRSSASPSSAGGTSTRGSPAR